MTKKSAARYKKYLGTKEEAILIKGSNIPLTLIFDYFIKGLTISDFMSSYPWVNKKDLEKKLEEVKEETASKYAL